MKQLRIFFPTATIALGDTKIRYLGFFFNNKFPNDNLMFNLLIERFRNKAIMLKSLGLFSIYIIPESSRISYLGIIRATISPFLPSLYLNIDNIKRLVKEENELLAKALKQFKKNNNIIIKLILGIEPNILFAFRIILIWVAKRLTKVIDGYNRCSGMVSMLTAKNSRTNDNAETWANVDTTSAPTVSTIGDIPGADSRIVLSKPLFVRVFSLRINA